MTAASAQGGEWRIADTSKSCSGCGARFPPEQEFFSQLEVGKGDGLPALARKDWCRACWPAVVAKVEDPIYWKTRRKGGDDGRNIVDINSLHRLFLDLLEDTRPEVEALRYVVALLLLRKKVLKVIRGARGAKGDLVFKDPRDTDRRLRLAAPDLSAETLANLKEQLGQILGC